MSFSADDADNVRRQRSKAKPRPKGKLPYPPGRDADFTEVRDWLSDAAGLPPGVRIESVQRFGDELDGAAVMVLSNQTVLRCPHVKLLTQPRTLQAFFAAASDGVALPLYVSPAEAGDFHAQLCRLSGPTVHADPKADLHERLSMFTALCQEIVGSIADRAHRFVTIEALRKRPAFDRGSAMAMQNGHAEASPVLLRDTVNSVRYIRASEWVAYLRFALGRTVDESGLVGRMAEIGSERLDPQAWNSDRSRKVHLVFYSLPEDL